MATPSDGAGEFVTTRVPIGAYRGTMAELSGEMVAAQLPLNSHSNVYEAARLAKAGQAVLFGFSVYNSNASAQFIQLHDAASIPADGAVPTTVWTVAGASNLNVAWVIPGRTFQRGIVICNSSTGPTKTVGSGDCWFDVQFI